MLELTPTAVTKSKGNYVPAESLTMGLRVAVVGGGCSGFSYHMAFENQVNKPSDNV